MQFPFPRAAPAGEWNAPTAQVELSLSGRHATRLSNVALVVKLSPRGKSEQKSNRQRPYCCHRSNAATE
jgi:hypothetical protein